MCFEILKIYTIVMRIIFPKILDIGLEIVMTHLIEGAGDGQNLQRGYQLWIEREVGQDREISRAEIDESILKNIRNLLDHVQELQREAEVDQEAPQEDLIDPINPNSVTNMYIILSFLLSKIYLRNFILYPSLFYNCPVKHPINN